MCAVFGIIGQYDTSLARYALSLMHHRGPDYCGIVEKKNFFFAHSLLTIMDTSQNAQQPYIHADIILSFNGEIYNFKELRSELK
jgi:asparagine synthase (glutamine-hydrolysing)